jgi:HicB family
MHYTACMTATLTIRVDEGLAELAKRQALLEGVSLNQYASDLLRAALDPASAGTLVESLRERLQRAGLTVATGSSRPSRPRPHASALAAAMEAAGKGTPLSDIVAAGRG